MRPPRILKACMQRNPEEERFVAQTAEKPQRTQKQNRFINYTQSEWDFAELERLERKQREKW